MLGLYASQEAQQHAELTARSRAEVAKVGVNAPQRVDAVGKWITGMVGEADAKQSALPSSLMRMSGFTKRS